MSEKIKLGNGNWGVKENGLLGYNDEDNIFKAIEFDFSRSSTATRESSAGLIADSPLNTPRIDFTDGGALLLEPIRTNYILKSDDVLSTYQSQNGDVSNASEAINGFNNSIQIEYSAINNSLVYKRDFTPTPGTKYTVSLFVQMDDNSEPIHTADANNGDFSLINNNTIADASDIKTERLGNTNIYRVSSTKTATDTNNRFGIIKYSTQSLKGFRVTGIQLEAGSYATSYIPTSGATATRIAETCSKSGLENYINSSEGVLYVETKGFTDLQPASTYIQLSKSGETGFNNSLTLQHRDNGTLRVYVNGTATANITFIEDIDFSQNHKIAVLYKLNGYKLFIDGVKKNLYLTPSQTVFSGLDSFSFDLRGSSQWNGKIKDLRVYDQELSDEELQNLTTL